VKIGVISDTHISDAVTKIPKEILEAFKSTDMIIHAGDLVDLSVINELKSVCKNVVAVSGNMDSANLKDRLPEKEIIKVGIYKIGITHGLGHLGGLISYLEKKFQGDNVDVVIFGHSHNPFNEKRGNILYFNPGSPTDKVFAAFNSYGILEINDKIEAKIIKI